MNQDKLFIIAVGGTGMRCLESFTHLCAIGMFDNQEIEILTLDTDQTNGNKARVEQLIELYNRVKTFDGKKGGSPNADTFFSAKLNLYKFWTNYSGSGRRNYRNISRLTEGEPSEQSQNKMLSDLFLEEDTVQEFNLSHGYRAQTHLGSHLMFHGIVEAARNLATGENLQGGEKDLETFLMKLEKSSENARVFVFGSVFGGTGASSIPIIPNAFKKAIEVRSGDKSSINLSKVRFGSTLLTEYFSFKKPDLKQMSTKDDSVIADSSFFPLNSQAALQFYQGDPTVQSTYNSMYHIGWPIESKPMNTGSKEDKTITGGAEQKNPCHIVELLCACAAYDFFTRKVESTENKAEYLYRAVEFNNGAFNFDGNDMVGNENKAGDVFTNRLGAFLSLAHIALSKNGAAIGDKGIKGFLNQLKQNKIDKYSSLSDEETIEIDEYLKLFAYTFDNNKNFIPGWIYQIRSTVNPGKFLFNNSAFTENTKELQNLDMGAILLEEKNHWEKPIMGSRYDSFVKKLINQGHPKEAQKVTTTKEEFLAHIYNGITISQKFGL